MNKMFKLFLQRQAPLSHFPTYGQGRGLREKQAGPPTSLVRVGEMTASKGNISRKWGDWCGVHARGMALQPLADSVSPHLRQLRSLDLGQIQIGSKD